MEKGRRGEVIGFVLHFLAFGCWLLAVGLGELGSFRIFWLLVVGDWLLAWGNWVRFAELPDEIGFVSHNRGGRGGKLGSFRIFWVFHGPPRLRLGSFRIIGGASGTRLGSFRVFGLLALWDWVRFVFLCRGSGGRGVECPAGGTGGLN